MIGYVTKDRDGEIYLHTEEPTYDDYTEGWYSTPDMINITGQFSEFNNISYTDEPIKIELSIKRI